MTRKSVDESYDEVNSKRVSKAQGFLGDYMSVAAEPTVKAAKRTRTITPEAVRRIVKESVKSALSSSTISNLEDNLSKVLIEKLC